MTTIYAVGTVTVANGGTTVTGVGTSWVGKVFEGDLFTDPAQGIFARVTADATSNTALTINAWPGVGMTADAYEVLLQADSIRTSDRTRQLLEQMSVVEANGRGLFYRFSDSVTDADPSSGYLRLNNLTIGSATAGYIDNLDANGATVSAILDTWDDAGSSDGRGQLWLRSIADPASFHAFKVTGSVTDGTGYRKLTMEYIGGSGSFAADDELMLMFNSVGVGQSGKSAYEIAVEEGFVGDEAAWVASLGGVVWTGPYSGATDYVLNDIAEQNGSSWILTVAASTGNAPPTLPTTSNAYWQLLARQGIDGVGTVNSVLAGTGVAVDNTDPTAPVVSNTGVLLTGNQTVAGVKTLSSNPVLTGGGIVFPATQVPSANANTLDDYEEGTWTPVLTFATPGNLSVAYSSQKGSYEKIGRQVRISFNIVTSTFTYTTAAGLVNITGLPFICADDAPDLYTGALVHGNVASALHLAAQLQNNSAVILIIGSANAVAPTNLNVSHFPTATNFTLRGQIVFRTT